MKKKMPQALLRGTVASAAGLGAMALLLSACGAPPESSGSGSNASDYKACMVSDSGGFDDKSFNESSYDGLKAAVKALNIKEADAESKTNSEYTPNVRSMVQQGCNLTVTVGFNLGDTTKDIAQSSPNSHFAIVDYLDKDFPKNVKPLIYDTAQAAFLGGYLAAGESKTGKVATFGGQKIPTVTIFMDGFADGVKYYNQQKGKDVKLLGWDKDSQNGTFVGDFESVDKGKVLTQQLLQQGADIVMPVAGPVGSGAGSAVKEAKDKGQDVKLIWVDTDGYVSAPEYKSVLLSSVQKSLAKSVQEVVTADKDGKFDPTPYVGTLDNGGVGLAPFHDFDSQVSSDMKSELDQLKKDIISGKVKVESAASPQH